MLQSMGSQKVGHNLVSEQQQQSKSFVTLIPLAVSHSLC